MFNIHSVPIYIMKVFNELVWKINTAEKIIYLTFDDGPIPEITEFVLDVLSTYEAKATFFCVGENVNKNQAVFQKIMEHGHAVGNHTYNHLKGWQVADNEYFENIEKCKEVMNIAQPERTLPLFRPPYGRIKRSQIKYLQHRYKIIMWHVLTCDYDKNLPADICLKNSIKYTKPGSIVVFHDSLKAEKNLIYVLPKYIAHFKKEGYSFKSL